MWCESFLLVWSQIIRHKCVCQCSLRTFVNHMIQSGSGSSSCIDAASFLLLQCCLEVTLAKTKMIKLEEVAFKNKEVKLKKGTYLDHRAFVFFKPTIMTPPTSDVRVWQPLLFTSHLVQLWQRQWIGPVLHQRNVIPTVSGLSES